jgi:hypothetical protein
LSDGDGTYNSSTEIGSTVSKINDKNIKIYSVAPSPENLQSVFDSILLKVSEHYSPKYVNITHVTPNYVTVNDSSFTITTIIS